MPASLLLPLAALAFAASASGPGNVREVTLAAASGAPDRDVLASTLSSAGGAEALREAALGALAPAPDKVVRATRSFGTVTIDHKAHLARKAHCKDCHGAGPVAKIEFTPRIAHDRCLGCHREEKRGPMKCRECHSVPDSAAPPAQQLAGKAPAAAAGQKLAAAGTTPPLASTPSLGSVLAATGAPTGTASITGAERFPSFEAPAPSGRGFTRVLSIGYSALGGAGQGTATGPAVFFSARDDGLLVSLSIEHPGRTLGLLGAGMVQPLKQRWNAVYTVLAGFDAAQTPSLAVMPALGARAGIEWLGNRTTAGLSLTGVTDLVRRTDPIGNQVGGVTFALSATIGWVAGQR